MGRFQRVVRSSHSEHAWKPARSGMSARDGPATVRRRTRTREDSAALRASEQQAKIDEKSAELSSLTRTAVFLVIAVFIAIVTAVYHMELNLSQTMASTLISHKINFRRDAFTRGIMHYNGYAPGGKNVQLAISEFRQAAEAKDPNAGTALGMIYHKGDNVTKDVKAAMRWFEHSAELGEVRAMSILCFMHYKGHVDGMHDYLAAAKWCRTAAEEGDHRAQFNLGVMVAHGQGEHQDYLEAYKWVTLAINEMGDRAIDARNSLVTRMTTDEVEKATEMVFSWKEQNRNKKRGVVKNALASMLPTFGSWATTSVTGAAKPGLSGTANPPKEQDALRYKPKSRNSETVQLSQ